DHSKRLAAGLSESKKMSVRIVFKSVLTTPEEISNLCMAANAEKKCIGLIMWMHTFSPAKMWISGLNILQKPFVHLHTQFNRLIPWSKIDMNFMNLNQSAHGGREFGFMASRMRLRRKVIVGFWQDEEVIDRLESWIRVACAWSDLQDLKVARFGDNMRQVAVTEGDKVEAQMRLGFAVNGYGLEDLTRAVEEISSSEINKLVSEYKNQYNITSKALKDEHQFRMIEEAAKIELGMRAFLEADDFKAFTTNFENLHGLVQLPGLAVQRLMADGYGFGAEGDWKTAALVRAMKVMAAGKKGGTSFMEDYTYHLEPGNMQVLGAHMLEVCPSIAAGKPSLEVHPLSIGGKADPARLVFNTAAGPALTASLIDLGNRFRLIVNEVDVVPPAADLPELPVARVVWAPKPDLPTAASAWIMAGGAHHTGFSLAVTAEQLEDFADIAGIEYLLINDKTSLDQFKKELRWNEVYFHLENGI
ncbi:MAG: L-arabinose isomerase, partial [bacterium]